jgi:DNA modification methylase
MYVMMRLICGDAAEVIPRLIKEGVKVDMVFCSPNPLFYNVMNKENENISANIGAEITLPEYLDHLGKVFAAVYDLLNDTGSLWVHMMDVYYLKGRMLQVPERFSLMMNKPGKNGGWLLRGKRVWLRGPHEITTDNSNISPWDWEYIYWFVKQEKGYVWNDTQKCAHTSVVRDAPYEGSRADGGSGFPHQVMKECMYMTTKPGDIVLDCFMGTGETGIAALDIGRKFIGIDLFPDKVALTRKRLRLLEKVI